MKQNIINALKESLEILKINKEIELTPSKGHADFASNIAFKIAKDLKKSPMEAAQLVVDEIDLKKHKIKKIEIAKPGFINFFIVNDILSGILAKVDENYGKSNQKGKIMLEYVSANPTGYLHIGHARSAALGDTLANILKFVGNDVFREFYVNDAGAQIETLGKAVFTRYLQELGKTIDMPENTYKGNDIIVVAKMFVEKYNKKFIDKKYEDVAELFKNEAKKIFLEIIKKHLGLFNVKFDNYFSEKSLVDSNKVEVVINELTDTYKKEGALWLKTTKYGDDKDRVLVKNDGSFTYFSPDIAYHKTKAERNFSKYITILGADHAGYLLRQHIGAMEVGIPWDDLDILVIQLVRLIRNGKELKMSKRMGTSFTLIELLELVGNDATRFYLINRSYNSTLDFDINVAKEESSSNPIFYIHYAHARANQLLNKTKVKPQIGPLESKNELNLLNLIAEFPDLLLRISKNYKANLLSQYLLDLAREFHSYYNSTKIIGSDNEPQQLLLVKSVKQVISTGLKLLGISSLEKM